ncbi:hypothetical protein Scep_002860 [Stephania cephalantha]|uniref:Uncharacterized protein n=1 Tax=Stephania cephalantha TaxID=152367 RepID=A0AAP0LEQ3_9MAGN
MALATIFKLRDIGDHSRCRMHISRRERDILEGYLRMLEVSKPTKKPASNLLISNINLFISHYFLSALLACLLYSRVSVYGRKDSMTPFRLFRR